MTRRKLIPWVWLSGVVLFYSISGGILGSVSAPLWIWAVVGAVAVAVAVAWAGAWAGAVVKAVVGAGALAVAWAVAVSVSGGWAAVGAGAVDWGVIVAWAWVGAVALPVAGAGAGVVVEAGEKLLESFNRWQTFLILLGTSVTGLGLGWAIALVVRFGML